MENKASGTAGSEDQIIVKTITEISDAMNDDFNTAIALAGLFELSSKINSLAEGAIPFSAISKAAFDAMKSAYVTFTEDILGLRDAETSGANDTVLDGLMQLIIDIRESARGNKDFATSDRIRDGLKAAGIHVRDTKDGTKWDLN